MRLFGGKPVPLVSGIEQKNSKAVGCCSFTGIGLKMHGMPVTRSLKKYDTVVPNK